MPRKAIVILACGALIMFLTNGVRQSFGLFLGPISAELMLPTAVFSLSLAILNLVLGVVQPITSAIADRYGTARTIAICGVLHVIGLTILAHADSAWDLYTGAGLFIGLASTGTTFAVILGAVTRVAPERHRSMVLGIASAIASLGQLLVAPMNQVLITKVGWSMNLIILAIALGAIVPLSAALAGRARDAYEPATETQTLAQAILEAGRHPSYLYLTAGFFVCGFHVLFVATHLPNFLAIHGKPELAGIAIGLIGLCNFIGTMAFGYLGGKYSKKALLSGLYFGRALVFAGFLAVPISTTSILVFSATIGFLWLATVPLTTGLIGHMFGIRYLATLFGFVFMSHQLGSFAGSWMGGVLFDATGNYDLMWQISIALGILSGLLHLPIREVSARQPA